MRNGTTNGASTSLGMLFTVRIRRALVAFTCATKTTFASNLCLTWPRIVLAMDRTVRFNIHMCHNE